MLKDEREQVDYSLQVDLQKAKDEIENLKQADKVNVQQHEEILRLLRPISETYQTVTMLSKWVSSILVLISIIIGIILGITKLNK